jgi:hypothetical protein
MSSTRSSYFGELSPPQRHGWVDPHTHQDKGWGPAEITNFVMLGLEPGISRGGK